MFANEWNQKWSGLYQTTGLHQTTLTSKVLDLKLRIASQRPCHMVNSRTKLIEWIMQASIHGNLRMSITLSADFVGILENAFTTY